MSPRAVIAVSGVKNSGKTIDDYPESERIDFQKTLSILQKTEQQKSEKESSCQDEKRQ